LVEPVEGRDEHAVIGATLARVEGLDAGDRDLGLHHAHAFDGVAAGIDGEDLEGAEVAEEVPAGVVGKDVGGHQPAADDAAESHGVIELVDRGDGVGRGGASVEGAGTLHLAPPHVGARLLAGADQVDLLDVGVAEVGQPHVEGLGVPAEAPRVSDSVDRHFGGAVDAVGGRVVGGGGVRRTVGRRGRVDAHHGAQQREGVLAVLLRVGRRRPVAEPEVEVAVRTEPDLTRVVDGAVLDGRQQYPFGPVDDLVGVERVLDEAPFDLAIVVGAVRGERLDHVEP
jgi:hypothetical protein